jgi:thioredoxin 1
MAVIEITKENFEEKVIKSEKPVLLDFWAPWCGPCRMLSPIVDEVAEENDDIVVGKINVDNEEDLARKFGIQSIPTLVVMKNGEVAKTSVGVIPKQKILDLVK